MIIYTSLVLHKKKSFIYQLSPKLQDKKRVHELKLSIIETIVKIFLLNQQLIKNVKNNKKYTRKN